MADKKLLYEMISRLKGEALRRRNDVVDGSGASIGDSVAIAIGSASAILEKISFFQYGMNHEIPPEWEHIAAQILLVRKEQDSEYKEYQRLKKKFEG